MGVHLDNGGALINLTTIADNKITGIETININIRAQQTGISGVVSPSHSGLPSASSKELGPLYSDTLSVRTWSATRALLCLSCRGRFGG